MSQTDLNVANQGMPAARTDLNNHLAALASLSKGPSAPTTTFTGMLWLDDDTPSATVWTLNLYDGTDWIALGQFDTSTNKFTATDHVKTNATPNFTVAINEAAYVDVASAGTTDIGAAASNNVRITGTTTITSLGTAAAGITRRVRFAGALTLTHNAVSLILPTGANITTAADDTAEFTSLGSGNWICTRYNRKSGAALAGASNLVQRVYASTDSVATGTTTIPNDDTIPQNTEGTEFLTCSITPTSATNRLRITVTYNIASSTNAAVFAALFQDTTADALIVSGAGFILSTAISTRQFVHEMVAGMTSPTTFKLRIGSDAAVTLTLNGVGGARKFGGKAITSIIIDEIVP